jgi:hypothetical protein
MPGWDNTARRGERGDIFDGATPELYEIWLRWLLQYTRRHYSGDRRLIFVNAWNEWGEAAYLEPDEEHEYRFLEATARAVLGAPEPSALLAAIRRITDGNGEAHRLLDELDREFRVNAHLWGLIEVRELRGEVSRDRVLAQFQPIERSGVELPGEIVSGSVVGFLDVLDAPMRDQRPDGSVAGELFLSGWIATERTRPVPNSPVVFQLTSLTSSDRYVALVSSRVRRDDVVSHFERTASGIGWMAGSSLYSGYSASLSVGAVAPGSYRLDAIVPCPDGRVGDMLTLRSSILIP